MRSSAMIRMTGSTGPGPVHLLRDQNAHQPVRKCQPRTATAVQSARARHAGSSPSGPPTSNATSRPCMLPGAEAAARNSARSSTAFRRRPARRPSRARPVRLSMRSPSSAGARARRRLACATQPDLYRARARSPSATAGRNPANSPRRPIRAASARPRMIRNFTRRRRRSTRGFRHLSAPRSRGVRDRRRRAVRSA